MNPHHRFRWLIALLLLAVAARAADAPQAGEQHPAVKRARLYVQAIVARDWKTCAEMLLPAALERKKGEALTALRTASEERRNALLAFYGVQSPEDLERLSGVEFYVAERTATYRPLRDADDSPSRQLATLSFELLAVAPEEGGRFVHVLLRTQRDTTDLRIRELMLVSVLQNSADDSRWLIVPDSLLPVTEPLGAAAAPAK